MVMSTAGLAIKNDFAGETSRNFPDRSTDRADNKIGFSIYVVYRSSENLHSVVLMSSFHAVAYKGSQYVRHNFNELILSLNTEATEHCLGLGSHPCPKLTYRPVGLVHPFLPNQASNGSDSDHISLERPRFIFIVYCHFSGVWIATG
jgi:hypothetical protein